MKIGLGSGSTAEEFVRVLAPLVAEGLSIIGVPTSERTGALARELGVQISTLEIYPHLDLTIDGADELDGRLQLIKGGGAAHLREKIVACASDKVAVIADYTKKVDILGAFPLPLEVISFGLTATKTAIEKLCENEFGLTAALTLHNGNLVLDASFGRIPDTKGLATGLSQIPGLVEHGLFIDIADVAFIAGPGGVETISPAASA
ncbi:UNVERIFIED_CONTAM: hypothetical protein GTU68_029811 [Idotea baltica]|nr:hypothetical protein [Idotea baltica]